MACPLPIFDDSTHIEHFRGANFAHAKPLKGTYPEALDYEKVVEDYRQCLSFLLEYTESPDTFKSYRREVDRFLLWVWFVRKVTLTDIKRTDIESFILFLRSPPLAWRGVEQKPRYLSRQGQRVPNPLWRPFVCTVKKQERKQGHAPDRNKWELSSAAHRACLAVLRKFFGTLTVDRYVEYNPVLGLKGTFKPAKPDQQHMSSKRLTPVQMGALFLAVQAERAHLEEERYERLRFIIACMVSMYLRISEIASPDKERRPTHGSFQYRVLVDNDEQIGSWWFRTISKGNKERFIPVDDDLLEALKRYRKSQRLTPLPAIGEERPLFPSRRGGKALSDSRHVRRILQRIFNTAEAHLRKNKKHVIEADRFQEVTAHWLRHTGISQDAQTMPLSHVQQRAGHAAINTTGRYIADRDVELHKSTVNRPKLFKQDSI